MARWALGSHCLMPDNDCNCRAGQQHGSTVGAAAPAALAGRGGRWAVGRRLRRPLGSRLGPYKILPIFYCNKGGRGENLLRNIVGNKGGLGGGYCTIIMCNNAPFSVSRTIIFSDISTHPKSDHQITRKHHQTQTPPKNTEKHLKIGRGGAITGNNIVKYIAQ